jgi:hypothetical protein
MKKPKTMTKDELNHLVSSLGMEELTPLVEGELSRIEGGRARLRGLWEDGGKSLLINEIRVNAPE